MDPEEAEGRGFEFFVRKPFQYTARADFADGLLQTKTEFRVPRRKLLVIENISATLEAPIDQQITSTQVRTVVNRVICWHSIFVPKAGTFEDKLNIYCGGQQVRIYADPNTQVAVLVHRNQASCPTSSCGTTLVFISGYLLPSDSPSLAP
jgi:hypothetical protein